LLDELEGAGIKSELKRHPFLMVRHQMNFPAEGDKIVDLNLKKELKGN